MIDNPLVSVIIPSWNAREFVGETLRSVTGQTWSHIEIIVVDDESTDDTASVVAACGDDRLTLIRQRHHGASSARNRGIANAHGDLIQFLDADDILCPDKLALQIDALRHAPDGAVASCTWSHFGEGTSDRAAVEDICTEPDPIEWLTQSLSGANMMHPAAWLVPRAVADAAGPWNEMLSLHDDGDYFARVLTKATRNVFVRDAHVFYRAVHDSLSRRRNLAAIESAFAVCKSRRDTLLGARDSARTREAIATQYLQFAYEFVSPAPDLAREAIAEISSLGVAPANRVGSQSFRRSVQLLGFRNALKLRRSLARG